ncbi:hypothetical protein AGLY_010438 [Aphis glycines]|uniref:Uncharacterized protein n=1 Tax=Aphis glycines TaxID=307491 RepID=A0A6G0TDJ8_APHGL|nr:hypothetical protein AGLY_010438 [Aphis glycines]
MIGITEGNKQHKLDSAESKFALMYDSKTETINHQLLFTIIGKSYTSDFNYNLSLSIKVIWTISFFAKRLSCLQWGTRILVPNSLLFFRRIAYRLTAVRPFKKYNHFMFLKGLTAVSLCAMSLKNSGLFGKIIINSQTGYSIAKNLKNEMRIQLIFNNLIIKTSKCLKILKKSNKSVYEDSETRLGTFLKGPPSFDETLESDAFSSSSALYSFRNHE